ncbi:MAG: caspase family protein [SAR324 cluster bacterium]|nr:caspase family protein [SAR324 cluster bacterium]
MFTQQSHRTFLVIVLTVLFVLTALGGVHGQASKGIRVGKRQPNAPGSERRVALVIGNANYKSAPLRNPVNDARSMAATLREVGFEVISVENGTRRKMILAIRDFGNALKRGGVGLFYYSGHGIELRGRNYMIPVGAEVETEDEVEFEGVDAGRVLRAMERANNEMNIVILDACRNNPFQRSFTAATQGLARMDAPQGTFISYATAPGKVASDGSGQNGLYTEQLVKHMKTPGIGIEEMFKRVRADVFRKSNRKQVPWTSSSLVEKFTFNIATPVEPPSVVAVPPRPVAPLAPVAPIAARRTLDEEEEFWKTIKNSREVEDIQSYLETYPKGRFAPIARVKIKQLQRARAAKPAPTIKVAGTRLALVQPRPKKPIRRVLPPLHATLKGHRHRVQGVAFSPDGKTVASVSLDRTFKVWDVESGNLIVSSKRVHSRMYAVAFSPDGALALTGNRDGTIGYWNPKTALLDSTLKAHRKVINSVAFSPDGKLAVTASDDETVKIWDVANQALYRVLKGHGDDVYSAVFSPDGKLVASASDDKTVIIWNVESGERVDTLRGHRHDVNTVAFSPDGKILASGSADKTIILWDFKTGRIIRRLTQHTNYVFSVAFSPDGKYLASSARDFTVRVWEVETGRMLRVFTGHRKHVYTVAFSPDGRRIVSGSADKMVKIWNMPDP